MFKIVLIAALIAVTSGAPQGGEGLATIVRSHDDSDAQGAFNYGYETSNGITAQATGYIKNPQARDDDQIQVIEGSYSYYTPEGQLIQVSYIADELGYRITSAPAQPVRTQPRPFQSRPLRRQ